MCLSFCDSWYLSCMKDFIDPYQNPAENLPFCKKDSLICSSVVDTIDSSRAFCEFMGFNVQSMDEVRHSGKACNDGIASVHRLKGDPSAKKRKDMNSE